MILDYRYLRRQAITLNKIINGKPLGRYYKYDLQGTRAMIHSLMSKTDTRVQTKRGKSLKKKAGYIS